MDMWTSITNLCNVPTTSPHFPFPSAPNGYESSGPMSRIVPHSVYPGSQQTNPRANYEFSHDPGYGPRPPREMQYGLQDNLPGEFDFEVCILGLQSGFSLNFAYRAMNACPIHPSMVLMKTWPVFSAYLLTHLPAY
jgi:hypothetical protein